MSEEIKLMENKICFIVCSNNPLFLEECFFYISRLEIPSGFEIETLCVQDAKSMTSGYNEGMRATNAKYKVYLHQDVFIVYKRFLQSVLDIFHSDPSIGMIGMVGSHKMPVDGTMWHGYREGALYGQSPGRGEYDSYTYRLSDGLYEVEAIDGLMMITSTDISWRQDIFDGWDFYDVSQSFEFQKKGYKVVVPEQYCAWCKHDDGILNLINYEKYRKICISEYSQYFYPPRFTVKKVKRETSSKINTCVAIIAGNQFEMVKKILKYLKSFSDVETDEIVIVDNGSQDGLHLWLKQQEEYNYIICGEMTEGYAAVLNEVIKQFVREENLLVLTPDFMILPKSIKNLNNILEMDSRIGAVYGKTILSNSKKFSEAVEYANMQDGKIEKRKTIEIPFQGVLFSNQMLKQIGCFDEQLFLPQNVMDDYALRGMLGNYEYYEISNTYFYQTGDNRKYYLQKVEENQEKLNIEKKWNITGFHTAPNNMLLSCIKKHSEEEFSVLEIGCACGANLLEIKNRYPMANTYGIEINPVMASIASLAACVQTGDIEEKDLNFKNKKFDYIMLGNVLEYLKNPEEVICYCRDLLKREGRVLVNVPNFMNYSVLRQLINGDFIYEGMGFFNKSQIHFFTYKEIVNLFVKAGYQIEELFHTWQGTVDEGEKKFVEKLVSLSNVTPEFMFWALQYYVVAKI